MKDDKKQNHKQIQYRGAGAKIGGVLYKKQKT